MQSYVSNIFMTGITSDWAMSMIEDDVETLRHLSLVQEWIESSIHLQEEIS